jgi:hypothetical protein
MVATLKTIVSSQEAEYWKRRNNLVDGIIPNHRMNTWMEGINTE